MLFVPPRIPYSQERFYTCSYLPYEPHTPLDNEDAFSRTSTPPFYPYLAYVWQIHLRKAYLGGMRTAVMTT